MRTRRRLTLAAALVALLLLLLLGLLWPRGGPPPPVPPDPEVATRPGDAPRPAVPLPATAPVRAGPRDGAEPAPDARGAFAGHVRSAAGGAAIAGAELTFARGGAAASVRTGADGAFRFEPPARGLWTLAAAVATGFLPFAPEWGTSPVLFDARPGAEVRGIEVVLEPAIAYRGEVQSQDGAPVAGAEVRVLGAAAGDSALVPLPERHRSGPDGSFRFVAPDGAVLEARAEGYQPGRAEVDRAARVSRRLVIRLGPAGEPRGATASISGSVVQGGGAPAPGALVNANQRGTDLPAGQAVADASGRFLLPDLPDGFYRLTASAPGLAPAARARVRAGASDVVLQLGTGGSVAGRVRDRRTGQPVAPFVVTVLAGDGAPWREAQRSLAVIDAEGRFAVDGLPPGPASVVVTSPAHAPSPPLPVTVPEGGAPAWVEVELTAGGLVEGTVVDRATRRPVAGAEVEAEGLLSEQVSVLPVRQRSLSGADGRFQVAGLPEGRASLFVRAEGFHARILSGVAVREGQVAGPYTVDLLALQAGEAAQVELAGIGAVLEQRAEGLRIRGLTDAGGAAEAGLLPGDLILQIDGRPVGELGFAASVQAIRGPEGTQVVLQVRRGAAPAPQELTVTVTRKLVRS